MNKKLVVIGGGAAGFFCAINAARMGPGLQVSIFEKTGKVLSKVKVSGGGRCNVTHSCFSIADMVKRYPRGANFLKKSFHHFFTTDTIEWFANRGVRLKTEADGRMFPVTDDSQTIIDCMLAEAKKLEVTVNTNTEIKSLSLSDDKWQLHKANNEMINADFVCIAAGGFPKASHFAWLRQLGHSIQEPVPSLFTFNMPGHPITQLMGITIEDVRVKIIGSKFTEQGPLLITHWGMSGPAILKLSSYAARYLNQINYDFKILINWLPSFNEHSLLQRFQELRYSIASQKVINRNPFLVPQRLWEFLLREAAIKEDIRWADLPAKEQNKLVKLLTGHEFQVTGKTTFKEEFVTAGGIKLTEVDPQTFASKLQPNLYFAGEILDIDGITGGYNFQSAWTGGYLAAKDIANRSGSGSKGQ
jgi:predicted Rossmann fold flavoprotein